MQIVALELENVKSYEHARFTFTPGVNAIVGHNGAGKSTIIEAIGYVLFDALPYTAHEFVREGARTGWIAVTLLSSYDERPYRIERRFGGSSSYAVFDVELDGKVCDGKTDVLAFVRRHTLTDPSVDLTRLFDDALGVAQGTLTTAFGETPARRKPIFDALLQVDDYSAAWDRLREPVRRLRDQAVEADRTLAVLATRLEQLPLLEAAIERRTREINESSDALAHIEQSLLANQKELALLEAQKTAVDTLTAQAARQEETLRSLKVQRLRAEQARSDAETAAAIVAANQSGYDAYLIAQQEQETLQQRAKERQSLAKKQSTLDKNLALAAAQCTQIEQALADVAAAEAAVRELAKAVQEQSESEQRVAALERAQSQLQELERRITAMETNRRKLGERLDTLQAGSARAQVVEAEGQETTQRLTALRADQEHARERLARLRSEIDAVEQQSTALKNIATARCPVCEQPLADTHRLAMLDRNGEQLAALRDGLAEQQAAITAQEREITALEETRTRLQREWRTLPRAEELANVTQAVAEAERELAEASAMRSHLAEQVGALADERAALAALNDPRSRSAVAAARAGQRPALENQLAGEQARQAALRAEADAVEAALKAAGDLEGALEANAAALRQHNAAYQALLTNRQVAESLSQRTAELTEIDGLLQRTDAEIARTRAELVSAIERFDLTRYQQLLLDDRTMREEIGRLSASLSMLRAVQTQEEAQRAALRAEETNYRTLKAQRARLVRQEEALEAIRSTIKQAGPYVTEMLVRQVSDGAAAIFGELMHDHRRVLTWGTDYGVTLLTDGVARTFRQLSGGEQMSAALAVRLALVREMSHINVAFFDEPTANLDSVRREALAQQIMTVRGFSQLFVISHDDTFEQATQNLIRVKRHGNTTIVEDSTG